MASRTGGRHGQLHPHAGPGRFYYTGFNVRFLDMKLLQHYLQQMVTMSPLQNYTLEIVPDE